MNDSYYIFWWNLENLFDTERARARTDKLRRVLRSELDGWTLELVKRKVDRLAEVIRHMNDGRGPDLMGVCEVENTSVLRRLARAIGLPDRDYAIAHHDCEDGRGIDVAFIYDKNLFCALDLLLSYLDLRHNTRN